MTGRLVAWLLWLSLCVSLVTFTPSRAFGQLHVDPPKEFGVLTAQDSNREWSLAISGKTVVWMDDRDVGTYGDEIYGYDLTGQTEFKISQGWAQARNTPWVSGNTVVWWEKMSSENAYIMSKNLSTGVYTKVADCPQSENVRIDGNVVTWVQRLDGGSQGDIYAKNISTGQFYPIATGPTEERCPTISGNLVSWMTGGGDMNLYNIATGQSRVLPATGVPCDLDGNILAFTNTGEQDIVYYMNLFDDLVHLVTEDAQNPSVDDGVVIFRKEYADPWQNSPLWGYDIAENQLFQISSTPTGVTAGNDIDGGVVVWGDARNGASYYIYGNTVVPEPVTLTLFGMAIGSIALLRRRLAKKQTPNS